MTECNSRKQNKHMFMNRMEWKWKEKMKEEEAYEEWFWDGEHATWMVKWLKDKWKMPPLESSHTHKIRLRLRGQASLIIHTQKCAE